jgi:glutathione synthase/RimK-type ligase-like ATP-grasp enzyme
VDAPPAIDPGLTPPPIKGAAALTHLAYGTAGLDDLLAFIGRPAATEDAAAALVFDSALAHALRFRDKQARALQAQALDRARVFRVEGAAGARPLRLLAVMAPGDLMVNTPLDFLTAHLDVRLDLLFVVPGQPLPAFVPEHDIAFFAVSESDPAALRRLAPLFRVWPRPALNDPAQVQRLTRDGVAAAFAEMPGILTPHIVSVSRTELARGCDDPVVVRPVGSHAGRDCALIDGPAALADYLAATDGERFFVANFIDYRGTDGLFRKYRIAFVGGRPFVCHMAASEHWMVHYLNAGMADSEDKRALEAAAFAEFDSGFAHRHRAALAAVDAWVGLDYHQIDCAEAPDGRLLLFEADTAAIVHTMDSADLFPYKPAQMQRVVRAFGDMLRQRAAGASAAA